MKSHIWSAVVVASVSGIAGAAVTISDGTFNPADWQGTNAGGSGTGVAQSSTQPSGGAPGPWRLSQIFNTPGPSSYSNSVYDRYTAASYDPGVSGPVTAVQLEYDFITNETLGFATSSYLLVSSSAGYSFFNLVGATITPATTAGWSHLDITLTSPTLLSLVSGTTPGSAGPYTFGYAESGIAGGPGSLGNVTWRKDNFSVTLVPAPGCAVCGMLSTILFATPARRRR